VVDGGGGGGDADGYVSRGGERTSRSSRLRLSGDELSPDSTSHI